MNGSQASLHFKDPRSFFKAKGDPGHSGMMFEGVVSVLNRAKGLPATQISSDERVRSIITHEM